MDSDPEIISEGLLILNKTGIGERFKKIFNTQIINILDKRLSFGALPDIKIGYDLYDLIERKQNIHIVNRFAFLIISNPTVHVWLEHYKQQYHSKKGDNKIGCNKSEVMERLKKFIMENMEKELKIFFAYVYREFTQELSLEIKEKLDDLYFQILKDFFLISVIDSIFTIAIIQSDEIDSDNFIFMDRRDVLVISETIEKNMQEIIQSYIRKLEVS